MKPPYSRPGTPCLARPPPPAVPEEMVRRRARPRLPGPPDERDSSMRTPAEQESRAFVCSSHSSEGPPLRPLQVRAFCTARILSYRDRPIRLARLRREGVGELVRATHQRLGGAPRREPRFTCGRGRLSQSSPGRSPCTPRDRRSRESAGKRPTCIVTGGRVQRRESVGKTALRLDPAA